MTDWHDRLSQPKYRMKVEKNAWVTMRDGVRLCVDIYRPDADGKFPALLGMSPYSKDVQKLPVHEYPTDREIGNGGIEAGLSEYFVSRGYVHVIADVRGTGYSEGGYRVFSLKEQQDGYDLVEWMAKQDWCSGGVGMLGSSYFAMIQLLVAAQQPPHLKAIFPVDSTTDMYRHWAYHGGILHSSFLSTLWEGSMVVNKADEPDLEKDELARIVAAQKENPDLACNPRMWKALEFPFTNPHLFDVLTHPFDGPYYRERSANAKFDRIKVPAYLIGRWQASYIHLQGAFQSYAGIQAPKRLLITNPESGVGFNRPWHENHDLVLRWYDHWLKGNDTGVMEEPPIRLYVQGTGKYRDENEWPLARTQWKKLYLGVNGSLSEDGPGWNEKPDSFVNAAPLMPGQKVPALRYATAPLQKDTELTGPAALYLHASLGGTDTNWIVEIEDLRPDGSTVRAAIGWLRASHREVDDARSKPYQPFHPHTRAVPVEPGKVELYAIDFREMCYVFKAGSRIQLLVKAQDAPWEGSSYIYRISLHLPPNKAMQHTVHHTPEHPSILVVPVIP
jgi:predicted acyl esterase